MVRTVVDTNIFISGIFWDGLPRLILDLGRDGKIEIFVSLPLLQELNRVLTGKKFQLTQVEVDRIHKDVLSYTTPVTPTALERVSIPDSRDIIVLEAATTAKVDYLVTGDPHLLNLHIFKGTKIVTAREFLSSEFPELLKNEKTT